MHVIACLGYKSWNPNIWFSGMIFKLFCVQFESGVFMSNAFKANRLICSRMSVVLCTWHKYSLNSCAYSKLVLIAQCHGGLCVSTFESGIKLKLPEPLIEILLSFYFSSI